MNVVYRLQYLSATAVVASVKPLSIPVLTDIKRSAFYDGAVEGQQWDNYTLSGTLAVDAIVYNRSNEKHLTRIRQQDPETGLWSLCDVNMYSSKNGGRANIWVNWIEVNADFG